MKVLVTDAQVRNSVAMVRALGKMGIEVHTCDSDKIATGFYSKYASKYFVHPDSIKFENDYIDALNYYIKKENIEVVFPIRDESTLIIAKNRKKIYSGVKIPIPPFHKIQQASNKAITFQIAEKIGIPSPKTYYPSSEEDLDQIRSFPVVLKPTFSSGSRGISFCNSAEELRLAFLSTAKSFSSFIV
ncbi:MAG: hypothetical protein SCK70_16750, partial [bacterium]|nr:hypothetical protein [bacterium]